MTSNDRIGRTGDLFASHKSFARYPLLVEGTIGRLLAFSGHAGYRRHLPCVLAGIRLFTVIRIGNPLACATGLLPSALEQNPESFRAMEYNRYYLEKWLGSHPRVEQVRICGTIAAMEVKTDAQSSYFNAIGSILRARFLKKGFSCALWATSCPLLHYIKQRTRSDLSGNSPRAGYFVARL